MVPSPLIARSPGPLWFRRVAAAGGVVYLLAVFLGSAGSSAPGKLLPRAAHYFTQVACLFPKAATHTIEYRAMAFVCEKRRFEEIDHRPYFPLRPNDKENRFERLGFFYRHNRQVMRALDDYLVTQHNTKMAFGDGPDDGIEGSAGGILFMSLRIPLPEVGTTVEPYQRKSLNAYPASWRKPWYKTAQDEAIRRCEGGSP